MSLIGSFLNAQIWNCIPLIVVISLVYGATRHEYLKEIIHHSIRSALWLAGFLGVILLIVMWMTTMV